MKGDNQTFTTNMKTFRLIVGHGFSIANETDSDTQSDYFPGIWGISTQKMAMKYAKEYIAQGHSMTVTDYDNPAYHALANKFIKELGLNQPLFTVPAPIVSSVPTNGKPATLAALKKFLSLDTKVRMVNTQFPDRSRDTFVKKVQSNNIVLDKNGGNSWLDFGKASDWSFDNLGATNHYIDRDGKVVPSVRIESI